MKRLLALALSLIAAPRAPARPPSLNVDVMLDAIAAVETGNNPHAVGKLGERGRCQFMQSTWARYTSEPFLAWAPVDCAFTRKIERAHLAWIVAQLHRFGQQPEPALIAAAWRHGVGNAVRCVREDYAQRAANLYFDALPRKGRG